MDQACPAHAWNAFTPSSEPLLEAYPSAVLNFLNDAHLGLARQRRWCLSGAPARPRHWARQQAAQPGWPHSRRRRWRRRRRARAGSVPASAGSPPPGLLQPRPPARRPPEHIPCQAPNLAGNPPPGPPPPRPPARRPPEVTPCQAPNLAGNTPPGPPPPRPQARRPPERMPCQAPDLLAAFTYTCFVMSAESIRRQSTHFSHLVASHDVLAWATALPGRTAAAWLTI